jgi:hypothetical protein
MPTEPPVLTLAAAAHRAVEVCDASARDADLGDFLVRFEDADGPIGDPDVAKERVYEELGALDPQAEDPALQMAAAVTVYLSYRRDEVGRPDTELLRLAARAEFDGTPPEPMATWLRESGVEL